MNTERKISKSLGNYIPADVMIDRYGADVLRLYVASMDYADDISVSERGIKEMSEAYRKIRNTFRYLLGNLEDYQRFDPSQVDPASLHEIDRWVLGQLNRVVRDVRAAYERFEFYRVHQRIYQFCAVELSSFYLDVLKDRLYAELPASPERRAAQFVLARLHDHLTRLLAPIIPHTAEESWDYRPARPDKPPSVHLAEFPRARPAVGRRRSERPLGRAARTARAGAARPRRPAEEQADRQCPGGAGPDHHQSARALAAGSRAAGDALHRLGGRDRRRPGGRRPSRSRPSDRPTPSASGAGTIGRPSGRARQHPTLCERCVRVVDRARTPADGELADRAPPHPERVHASGNRSMPCRRGSCRQ